MLALCPALLTLQAGPFFTLPTLKQQGYFIPGIFSFAWPQNTSNNAEKKQEKCCLLLLWRHSGWIFSISQVDFARLIKSSSLMSCLTSLPSLLPGAYSPAGATGQTDCCPAGMGLAARQGPEAHSPRAFVWIWSIQLEGVKQGERIEVIPSSSGLLPRGANPE